MKKVLLFLATSMLAMCAMAQQWAGSTTIIDTIYRNGTVRLMSGIDMPFAELSPSNLKVYKYNSTWREDYVNISYNGIYMGRNIPAPTNSTTIGIGTFTFRTGNPYYNGFDLEYNYEGILSSNGKIITTDSIVGKNIRATSSVDSRYVTAIVGNFSGRVSGSEMSINGASIPSGFNYAMNGMSYFSNYVGIGTSSLNTTFKFAVSGKSYFSDFVGIGTSNLSATSGFKLAVDGGILCEEVKVIASVPSADYVFEKDYDLKPLSEVEKFVNENKHLPDIPSANEFKENGYNMGEMDNLLLQKIEELTLYIIEQQKQIDELKNKLNE